MTVRIHRVLATVGIVLVACQHPSGPATIDCGPLSDADCERAVERAQRELGDDWPEMQRVVFIENGWDALTWGGQWKAFRTGDP